MLEMTASPLVQLLALMHQLLKGVGAGAEARGGTGVKEAAGMGSQAATTWLLQTQLVISLPTWRDSQRHGQMLVLPMIAWHQEQAVRSQTRLP